MSNNKPHTDFDNFEIIDDPAAWKWAVGITTAVLLGGILYGFNLFGGSLYYVALHSELSAKLSATTTPLPELLNNETFAPLLAKHSTQIKALIGIDGYIKAKELNRAASWSNSESLKSIAGHEKFSAAIKKLDSVSKAAKTYSTTYKQALLTKQGLNSQYAIQTSHFAELFGLEELAADWQLRAAKMVKNSDTEFEPEFYQRGILVGLPVLEPIPGDLEKYKDIAAHLPKKIAHSMKKKLNWSKSKLRKEIATLEADSLELSLMLEKSRDSLPELKRKARIASKSYEIAQQLVVEEQTKIICTLAQPELSKHALAVYAFIQKQGIFGELPEYKAS